MTVRLLFASFPVWSLGLLAWVPSLRFAVLRGRRRDWWIFGISVAVTVVYIVLLFLVPADDSEAEGTASAFAGLYIVALIVGSVVHAILGDRFVRVPRVPVYGPGPATPPPGYGYGYPPPSPYAADTVPQGYAPSAPASPAPAPPPAGAGAPQAPSSDRMRQVASELDELDQLLRRRGNDR